MFALQNSEPTSVKFLAWEYEASKALVLLSTFAMGACCGLLATLAASLKAKFTGREKSKPTAGKYPPPADPGKPASSLTSGKPADIGNRPPASGDEADPRPDPGSFPKQP